jgi:hypothetical protein
LITDDRDSLITDDLITIDSFEPIKVAQKTGGGNILQILVALIPSVFPKSYT